MILQGNSLDDSCCLKLEDLPIPRFFR